MAEPILHVVAENPKKPHVADDVKPAPVQEHARKKWKESFQWRVAVPLKRELNVRRRERKGLDECIARWLRERDLIKKHNDIRSDQQQRHSGE